MTSEQLAPCLHRVCYSDTNWAASCITHGIWKSPNAAGA